MWKHSYPTDGSRYQLVNEYLDILERQRYYNKQEVWGSLTPTRLEELFEPLDDYSLYETASQINENLDWQFENFLLI